MCVGGCLLAVVEYQAGRGTIERGVGSLATAVMIDHRVVVLRLSGRNAVLFVSYENALGFVHDHCCVSAAVYLLPLLCVLCYISHLYVLPL